MRLIAAVALIAAVTSAASAQQPWVWWNATCTVRMESWPDRPFRISSSDRSYSTECNITDWPISNSVATMTCEKGDEVLIQTNDATGIVKIGGLPVTTSAGAVLYPTDGVDCHGGVERVE